MVRIERYCSGSTRHIFLKNLAPHEKFTRFKPGIRRNRWKPEGLKSLLPYLHRRSLFPSPMLISVRWVTALLCLTTRDPLISAKTISRVENTFPPKRCPPCQAPPDSAATRFTVPPPYPRPPRHRGNAPPGLLLIPRPNPTLRVAPCSHPG